MHNNHKLGHKTAKIHVCAYNAQYKRRPVLSSNDSVHYFKFLIKINT